MSTVSNNHIAEAIYVASKDKNSREQALIFPKIVQFLSRRRLLSKSEDILMRLDRIINDREGRIIVKVSSVKKINEKTKKELLQSLSRRYPGAEVILQEKLDESL